MAVPAQAFSKLSHFIVALKIANARTLSSPLEKFRQFKAKTHLSVVIKLREKMTADETAPMETAESSAGLGEKIDLSPLKDGGVIKVITKEVKNPKFPNQFPIVIIPIGSGDR